MEPAFRERSDELLQQIERFANVTASAKIMVYEANLATGQICYFHGIENVLGTPFREGLARDWWMDRVHPDDSPRCRAAADRETGAFVIEYRVLHEDGHYVFVQEHAFVTCDERGQPVTHRGTIQDITGLKQTERRLRESEKRKEQFLAMLAHELRNPLATIQNGIAILNLDHAPPHMIAEVKTMMADQVNHILCLVDDLLDISRINRGKVTLRKERVDLLDVLERTARTYRAAFRGKGIRFETDIPQEQVFVQGDMVRLIQVFGNLLHNAAKYTDHGGRVVARVRCRDGQAITEIEDDGIGIPVERIASIFDLYERVDLFSDVNTEGLGLGLALVKELVDLHDGSVAVRSDGLGKGCTFTVTLDLSK